MQDAHNEKVDSDSANLKVCVVGASGKLGQYMVRHARHEAPAIVGSQTPSALTHTANGP